MTNIRILSVILAGTENSGAERQSAGEYELYLLVLPLSCGKVRRMGVPVCTFHVFFAILGEDARPLAHFAVLMRFRKQKKRSYLDKMLR